LALLQISLGTRLSPRTNLRGEHHDRHSHAVYRPDRPPVPVRLVGGRAIMAKKPVSDTTEKKLSNLKPFKPGAEWTGNAAGRPKSARNKLTEDFLSALADDFSQHGKDAIVTVRQEDPGKYLSVVAQLVPKETDVNVKADDAFVRIWQAVASGTLASLVEQTEDGEQRH
jgi:hypothetical protein